MLQYQKSSHYTKCTGSNLTNLFFKFNITLSVNSYSEEVKDQIQIKKILTDDICLYTTVPNGI